LSVGDTVNFSGATVTTAFNLGDVVVGTTGSTVTVTGTNTIVVKGTFSGSDTTNLKIRPKNTDVTAQSPSAGATTATVVDITRNYGL
jgi:hypothetical protein